MKARSFTNLQPHASFPLGGLGTGSISLHANGAMTAFEIFNGPAVNNKLPYSFFALHTKWGDKQDARVLESSFRPDFEQPRGYHPHRVMGLPRFSSSTMTVQFPFARIDFSQDDLPLCVSLEAFSPFIPLQADNSGIPAVVFRYTLLNTSTQPVDALIAASMPNIHNFHGFDCMENYLPSPDCENMLETNEDFTCLWMKGSAVPADALTYAENALLVPQTNAPSKPIWYRGGWWDSITDFWKNFREGKLAPLDENDTKQGAIGPQGYMVGSLGQTVTIAPGECREMTFVLAWYVPNRYKGWASDYYSGELMRNHYAVRFASAKDAGGYLLQNLSTLEKGSRLFSDALYASTLPPAVIDAVASNLTVLTSNTCWRDDTGTFLAWEGCLEQLGSCHGTCTHVWNYAQSVAYLFPDMERSARINEFLQETEQDGKMNFRTQRRFGMPAFDMHAAIDGQLGTIIRAWREYMLSGDKEYLSAIYPSVLRALSYAEATWDLDGDGIPEALQHNTYDIEFIGINPLSAVFYLGALHATARMADVMKDVQTADACRQKATNAAIAFDQESFNGAYYVQLLDDVDEYPYQHGKGCLSDQLLGQTMAYLAGLDTLLPKDHVKRAAKAIYDNNFLSGKKRESCLQRLYVYEDEPGLVLCSWPIGEEPRFPFVYAQEVWTGIEYQVATLLIYEGYIQEALTIVEAVRNRFDGTRRNPFDEKECGNHYARSLASYGLLVALSGFSTTPEGTLSFDPKINEKDFHAFYCDGRHFGILHQTIDEMGNKKQWSDVLQ